MSLGESLSQSIDAPVRRGIGGVVEHLPDNFSADGSICGALDLNQRASTAKLLAVAGVLAFAVRIFFYKGPALNGGA